MSVQAILGSLASRVAGILEHHLPTLGADWWQALVVDRLSIQQQRLISERRISSLSGLDPAALLRVFNQNLKTATIAEISIARRAA